MLSNEQLERYSRHIILKEVGAKGQKKLLNAKVLIIGAGGLGAPAAMYLAAAGVGTIGIADADEVDLSNLQRQIIHSTQDVGKAKVQSAKETMEAINPDVKVIYPIHKNPQVRKIAEEVFAGCDRIRMVEPLDVMDFHNYMKQSYLILTDSGGIQEEAPALGIPVLVMRDTTERPEGVEAGILKLVGTDEACIIKEAEQLLWDKAMYEKMSQAKNPYGDGHASERIVECLLKEFGG